MTGLSLVKKQRSWLYFVTFYVVILGGGWLLGQWLPQVVELNILPADEQIIQKTIMMVMVVFVLISAIPFVPGAEIGFALIMLFGGKIAILVYFGMILALFIAFLVGRLIPLHLVAETFDKLGFKSAHMYILKLSRLDPQGRLLLLSENAPNRLGPVMLRHRYILLMVALNLPGNSLVGGGGGIAFIAGLSGLFSYYAYLIAILIAVSPVPIFFYFTL